jgi:protein ImuB
LIRLGQGGVRLVAVDPAAAARGLAPGMGLADARALVPDLIAADAEPERDAQALAALVDWCGRYSPWGAPDGADGIRLDITGAAHLFGGEAAMLADALRRLAGFGLTAAGAIADTPAAAWGWAHFRPTGSDPVLPAGCAGLLDPLPAAALRLGGADIEMLNGLGLSTIGLVRTLPRAPLAARLGAPLLARLDRMLGDLAEPISPFAPVEPFLARLIFAEPISRREDLDALTLQLVERLCRDLTLKGQGARRLALAFYRVDATLQRIEIGTSRPTHAPAHLARLFAPRLETIDPGFGIEAVVLTATETQPLDPVQGDLPSADGLDEVDLAALIDRLRNRLGGTRVLRLTQVESHVPERAEIRVCGAPLIRLAGRGKSCRTAPVKSARPIKLLAPPEPIEAMAPVPDDPPLFFRWRRVMHRIAAADGPERIGPEWWAQAPGRPRDYYRVEDSEGRRFWLYREGPYGGEPPPRWFLHGFFA